MADALAYKYELSPHQVLYIAAQGTVTTVTIHTSGHGQQQQSSNQFSTGTWTSAPQLYPLDQGCVVAIATANETYYLQIQGGQSQMSQGAIAPHLAAQLNQTQPLTMEPTDTIPTASMPPMKPMAPMQMQPMQPMQMPPMQMSSNPMAMSMGNMAMSMGQMSPDQAASDQAASDAESTVAESSQKVKRFCGQCGSAVQPSDRFCAYCGDRLT
ncbi:MAG: zinc-ribbon domain-containing protein [Phormidesmis sp.]